LHNGETTAQILREIPPSLAASLERFRDDLEELLQDHAGQFAAYGPDGRIALGPSKMDVYQQCRRSGREPTEFIVRKIQPSDDQIEVLFDV
jgi:hypothetical protein